MYLAKNVSTYFLSLKSNELVDMSRYDIFMFILRMFILNIMSYDFL